MNSIEAIFSEALTLTDPGIRRKYLDGACGGDSAMRDQVEELLRAHDEAGGFLEGTTRDASLPPCDSGPSALGEARSAGECARQLARQLAAGAIPSDAPPSEPTPAPLPGGKLSTSPFSQAPLPGGAGGGFRGSIRGASISENSLLESVPPSLRTETLQRLAALQASRTMIERDSPRRRPIDSELPEFAGFRIERKLGQGGLGSVYLAYDEKLRRQVALKVLSGGESAAVLHRVLEEARKAASLRDPAIVTVYSVHDVSAAPAIVMEWVEGFPVDRATTGLTFLQKARILQEIAHALAVAHRSGVIHRDLKPENVIVTPDLRPKVLDFGLAVSLEEAGVRRRFFEGTPRYASPEQISGQPLTPASDVFSYGSLMFKVLTGRPPFDGATTAQILEAICTSEPPFLRDVSVGVPEELQAICLACLAWEAKNRPSAEDVALDLGRYLAGEPVRLRPALYGDILRRRISEYSNEVHHWESQGMISADEKDRLQTIHRRILADEDHWIIDARKLSIAQTVLYTGTWLVVLAAALFVWLVRREVAPPWTWMVPLAGTLWLLGAGLFGSRRREPLASASFLAGAVLSVVATSLAFLAELRWLSSKAEGVTQLLPDSFSNTQILVSSAAGLGLSVLAWIRLRMTGFAWTSAILATLVYLGALLGLNWLGQKPEVMALWCLPLVGLEAVGLWAERIGRVRWALPFHGIALLACVVSLDVMAGQGPTLAMWGLSAEKFPFFDPDRQRYFSFAANGYLFLVLMLLTERARSLDLRRASRVLEPLALLHILGALYANAQAHRDHPQVATDAGIYIGSVLLLLVFGPWRSRWRILVGALGGVALGSYLLIDLNLVGKTAFTIGLGVAGLLISTGTFFYLRISPRSKR